MEGGTTVNIIELVYNNIPSILIAFTVAGIYYFRGPDAVMLTLSMSILLTLTNRYRMNRNERKKKDMGEVLEE